MEEREGEKNQQVAHVKKKQKGKFAKHSKLIQLDSVRMLSLWGKKKVIGLKCLFIYKAQYPHLKTRRTVFQSGQ